MSAGVGLIASHVAREALSRRGRCGEVRLSLDLGLSSEICEIRSEGLYARDVLLEWDFLETVSEDERGIYTVEKPPRKLYFSALGHFYMLAMTSWGHAPTVEIDGVHMHRVRDMFPEEDARRKVELMGRLRCRNVLDICTGLGYTAIWAKRLGACSVKTIEKDENILELARYNPWSRELFTGGIEIIKGDAVGVVEELDERFDAILNDPPTIKIAGELYSRQFYQRLYELLKRGGILIHYVGEPGVRSGKRIYVGVLERLRSVGFSASLDHSTRCVKAVKV
ncbi:MAG: methyltransferase [Aigarchaeota archaeon]|nr:methyltransferase [Candidatus Pelearchaeum maunauluense]